MVFMMKKSQVPVILVGGAIFMGLAIIIVSLYSNRVQWDRDTVVSAANYDGEALIKQLAVIPATAMSFREVDSGPLISDLSNAHEAWITWKETFSSQMSFSDLAAAYRENLGAMGWTTIESTDRNDAGFRNGEWSVTLTLLPLDATSASNRFRRLIEWRTLAP